MVGDFLGMEDTEIIYFSYFDMQLNTSYKQILKISLPIMLASATQNIIALTDSVFLFHKSENDFAAIGFVSVFYLIIAAIGYGFSKGGQVIIARKYGEGKNDEVSAAYYAMLVFELGLAIVMFFFLYYGTGWFFSLFVDSDIIYQKSLEYIKPRSFGVIFSYVGIGIVAMYTGIAKTWFIVVDTLILATVNIVLNYGLIFGHFGLPEMGIAGAAWASTIAEFTAFAVFIVYMFFDPISKKLSLFTWPHIEVKLIKDILRLSMPGVIQAVLGMGSWFLFFSLVENLGERQLAITNLVRISYLALSIPAWGFAAGINTMVSNYIGSRKARAVLPIVKRTAILCMTITMLISIPVLLFPEYSLYPLLGSEDMSLIREAQPTFYILLIILFLFSIGSVVFNGLTGTGMMFLALKLQAISTFFYLGIVYFVIKHSDLGLNWAWTSEIAYWMLLILLSWVVLKRREWKLF